MAPGSSKWGGGDSGRRTSEYDRFDDRDRDRDRSYRDYRDRSPTRDYSSPRGRGRGRGRGSPPSTRRWSSDYPARPPPVMSPSHDSSNRRSSPHKTVSTNSDKALGQESATRNIPKSDAAAARTDRDTDIKLLTNLICEKVSWMQKKEAADNRLEKLRADHERSGTKHVDFPSVVEMFQSQIKTATSDLVICTKQIFTIDEQLKTTFGHLSPSQILPGLAGQTRTKEKKEPTTKEPATKEPATKESVTKESATKESVTKESATKEPTTKEPTTKEPTTKEPTTKEPTTKEPTTKAPSNPDKQPTESQDAIPELSKPQLDNELSLFKRKAEQSIRELKAQTENTSKANRRLESENQRLKSSQEEMNRKFKQLEENLAKLEQKYDGGQTKVNCRIDAMHEQVKKQIAAVASEPRIKPEPKVYDTDLEKAIKEHDSKILSVQGRLDPAITEIEHLKQEMSSKLTALEDKQATVSKKVDDLPTITDPSQALSDFKLRLSEQESRIDSLAGEITILQPLASNGMFDKMTQVADDVSKMQERLDLDKASAKPDFITEERVHAIMAPALVKVEKDMWPKLHQRLDKVAEGLGGFLDKERIAREATKSQVQGLADQVKTQTERITALADQVKSLSQAVDEVKTAHQISKEAMERQNQARGSDDELRNYNITALRSQVDGIDQELRKGQEALQMQLLHLTTIPTNAGLGNQMRDLENRLGVLESREDGDGQSGLKKRKVLNGTAVTVNNGH
ncbi:hypothetical protein AK830_g9359 [Neonectria ditissima]|uniref:Uncharacterized protein n=1 Tax=Neonectria ditissima TaxID=78410 RepID=A0A0P7AS27_9HYPO|nr:hypothetical protein AK830_g9359 [Neonectria ditissima]